jgi:glycosyltransferase involved in cell wall biosynthesis
MKSISGLQTVAFPGKVEYGRVPNLISEHDVFLLTSDYEGLPLSLLEAMGHGLVPVVSDLPSGISEVVNENTGFRVATTDIEGYAKAIIWLHQNRLASRKLSENARECVLRDFSTEAMLDRWLATFPGYSSNPVAWPVEWKVKPLLVAENLFRFSPTGRILRRLKFAARRSLLK